MGAALLFALLLQDPTDWVQREEMLREMMRRAQSDPAQAQSTFSNAVRDGRNSPQIRLEAAEALLTMKDRDSWTQDISNLVQDPSMPPEIRARAALLLNQRTTEVGKEVDGALSETGTDDAAKAIGTHLRTTSIPELQGFQIDSLLKMNTPASRTVLWDALTDDTLEPSMRLTIAERFSAAGRLDRVLDARKSLEQIRDLDPSLADRVDALLAALRAPVDEPAVIVLESATLHSVKGVRSVPAKESGLAPSTVNMVLGGATLLLLAGLFFLRRRA